MKNYIATALLLSSTIDNTSALKLKQQIELKSNEQAELVAEADALAGMDLEATLDADEQQEVFEVTDIDPNSVKLSQISLAQIAKQQKQTEERPPNDSQKLQISSYNSQKKIDQDNLIEAVASAQAMAKTEEEKDAILQNAQALMAAENAGANDPEPAQDLGPCPPEFPPEPLPTAQPLIQALSSIVVPKAASAPVAIPAQQPIIAARVPIAANPTASVPTSIAYAPVIQSTHMMTQALPVINYLAPTASAASPMQPIAQQMQIAPSIVAATIQQSLAAPQIKAGPVKGALDLVAQKQNTGQIEIQTKLPTVISTSVPSQLSTLPAPVVSTPKVEAQKVTESPKEIQKKAEAPKIEKKDANENKKTITQAAQMKEEQKKVEDKKHQVQNHDKPKETIKNAYKAPKSLMQVESSQDTSEFEKDFIDIDEDAEDEDATKALKKSEVTQIDTQKMNQMTSQEKETMQIKQSISKVKKNMEQAKEALSKRKDHNKELQDLIKAQKGMAKKELKKVLKRSKAHIFDIENHIKKGSELLEKKQKNLVELDPKEEDKKVEQNDFEMDFTGKSAVKSDKDESKKEAKKINKSDDASKPKANPQKKEAVKEAKNAESGEMKEDNKKIDDKVQSDGFDIQSLTEKNNKMWDVKMKEAEQKYEKETKEAEEKFKKEINDKSLKYESENKQLQEKHKKQLTTLQTQYTQLKSSHDVEVKQLFENIDTLKFTKEMRFFKKQWDEEKDEHKRKKIAAAMANATKTWVSDGEKMD